VGRGEKGKGLLRRSGGRKERSECDIASLSAQKKKETPQKGEGGERRTSLTPSSSMGEKEKGSNRDGGEGGGGESLPITGSPIITISLARGGERTCAQGCGGRRRMPASAMSFSIFMMNEREKRGRHRELSKRGARKQIKDRHDLRRNFLLEARREGENRGD